MGDTKGGAFDIPDKLAQEMLAAPLNPNGRPNSDVVRPWVNGMDITRRPRGMWIIDFGVDMPEEQAALYEQPYQYVRQHVLPARRRNKRASYGSVGGFTDGVHDRPCGRQLRRWTATLPHRELQSIVCLYGCRRGLCPIAVSMYSPARMTTFSVCCTRGCMRCGRWLRRPDMGTAVKVAGRRITTLPASRRSRCRGRRGRSRRTIRGSRPLQAAARELVALRDRWLDPAGASERELKGRTLTNLYNSAPDVAGPGAPAAGRGGAGGLRVAGGFGRRGAVGAAAGAELGAGRVGAAAGLTP